MNSKSLSQARRTAFLNISPFKSGRLGHQLSIALGALLLLFTLGLFLGASAEAKTSTHTVYAGQRLGSIAKRYNISVEALCRANGITQKSVIHPGQKLIIPGADREEKTTKKTSQSASHKKSASKPLGRSRTHVIAKGHTLSAIAGRYAITVTALCHANAIGRNASLRVGQKLIIPHRSDQGGKYAAEERKNGKFKETTLHNEKKSSSKKKERSAKNSKTNASWKKYVKPAWRRGYIKIYRYGRAWEGYVIGPKGEVLGHASKKINFVMGAKDDGPRISPKLIRLIASVSDKFGGRKIRIVSGYRTKSFVAASKHKKGKAIDFSIPGIPNPALRDYLRTVDNVGVGFYPNSSFVHLDVRGYNSYWVDHAGPGEAPRKNAKKKTHKKTHKKTSSSTKSSSTKSSKEPKSVKLSPKKHSASAPTQSPPANAQP